MTATYNTVSIGGTEYEIYADVPTSDAYMAAEISAAATKWRDATLTDEDAKSRALVSATRLIDRQVWPGTKTEPDYQELAWPRTGTGITGVDPDIVPQQIIDASILLAAEINNGSSVVGSDSTDTRKKRQKAGSVEIEYFRDLDGGKRFPTAVEELLRQMRGSAMLSSVTTSGVDTCSRFTTDYGQNIP